MSKIEVKRDGSVPPWESMTFSLGKYETDLKLWLERLRANNGCIPTILSVKQAE
jgi:hypothetical protein